MAAITSLSQLRQNPFKKMNLDYVQPAWENLSWEQLEEVRAKTETEFSRTMQGMVLRLGYEEVVKTSIWYSYAQPLAWIKNRQKELRKEDQKDEEADQSSRPMVVPSTTLRHRIVHHEQLTEQSIQPAAAVPSVAHLKSYHREFAILVSGLIAIRLLFRSIFGC